MQLKNSLLITLATVLFIACNNNSEKGTVITADQFEKLTEDKANAGKRLSLIGYPAVLTDQRIGADQKGTLSITTKPMGEGESLGLLRVRTGDGKNEMYVPDSFTIKDLMVYDNEGKPLTAKDKIQVSFTVDMDTDRAPHTTEKLKMKDGKPEFRKVTAYFGQGPVDIRIDKIE